MGIPSKREVEAILREAGFSRKQACTFISEGYSAVRLRDAGQKLSGWNKLITKIIKI